jgi:hypothetical protein
LDGLRWHVLGDSHAALHSAAEAGETTGVAVMSRRFAESQFTTFKHKYKSHIGHKAKPAIHYIDEVKVGKSGSITNDAPVKSTDK